MKCQLVKIYAGSVLELLLTEAAFVLPLLAVLGLVFLELVRVPECFYTCFTRHRWILLVYLQVSFEGVSLDVPPGAVRAHVRGHDQDHLQNIQT